MSIRVDVGNCYHEVWSVNEDIEFKNRHTHYITKKGVWIANNDDPHYAQCFQTPEEVDQFIRELFRRQRNRF